MACIPPTLKIEVIPQRLAVYNTTAGIFPELSGGVHKIISLHPAILAGTANIKIVENNGAEPPGIYKPTFSIAFFSCQQFTPGSISIRISGVFCAE